MTANTSRLWVARVALGYATAVASLLVFLLYGRPIPRWLFAHLGIIAFSLALATVGLFRNQSYAKTIALILGGYAIIIGGILGVPGWFGLAKLLNFPGPFIIDLVRSLWAALFVSGIAASGLSTTRAIHREDD